MALENGVKNIQAAAYNCARTVHFTKDENAPSERISHHYVSPAPGASCRVSNPGISVLLCVNWRFHKANYFGRPNRSTPQIKQMPVVKTSRLLEKIITGGPSLTQPPLMRFIFSLFLPIIT